MSVTQKKEGITFITTRDNDNFCDGSWLFLCYIFSDDGCMSLKEKSAGPIEEVKYVPMNWFETPTIVYRGAGGNAFIKRSQETAAMARILLHVLTGEN